MRVGEASRLAWADVDPDSGEVAVRLQKNGSHRVSVLDRRSLAWLARWRKVQPPSPLVFGVQKRALQKDVERTLGMSAHSLRRGFAVDWLRRGGRRSASRYWPDGGQARPWRRATRGHCAPRPRW